MSSGITTAWRIALDAVGKRDEAIAERNAATRINPNSRHAQLRLGDTLLREGKLDGAIDAYRQAVRLKPDFAPVLCRLAYAIMTAGRTGGAIDAIRCVFTPDRGLARAHAKLAAALREKGQLKESAAELRAAIRINPVEVLGQAGLGRSIRGEDPARRRI